MECSYDEVCQTVHIQLASSYCRVDKKNCGEYEQHKINRSDGVNCLGKAQNMVLGFYIVIVDSLVFGVGSLFQRWHPVLCGKQKGYHTYAEELAKDLGGLDNVFYINENYHQEGYHQRNEGKMMA